VTRKRNRRQRVGPEDRDLEHLGPGADRLAFDDSALVADADDAGGRRLGDVVHAQESGELDLGVDLLAALAHRRAGGVLVVVDEAAGQAPLPQGRLDGAPPEHDAAVVLHHHRRRDLRISPENEAVAGANLELATLDELRLQRSPAVDAEMTHPDRM
jgi:hypothetical protein